MKAIANIQIIYMRRRKAIYCVMWITWFDIQNISGRRILRFSLCTTD